MSERIWTRIFTAEVLGYLLVLTAVQVLLYGMEAFLRGAQTGSLFWVCLSAACIGVAAGRSGIKAAPASAAIVGLGIVGVWILGARIAVPILDLVWSVLLSGPQLLPEVQYRFDVEASGIASAWNVIGVSSAALFARWQTWLGGALENFRVNDALIRNMLWTFGLWLLCAWTGWFAARRNALASLLPGAALLTVMMATSERRVEALWAFIVIMLLLMGIWNYKQHTAVWEKHHIDFADSIRYDLGQSVVIITVVVGLIAFVTPSISWRDVRDYLRELERERERARQAQTVATAGTPQAAYVPVQRPAPNAELPREHLLTAGYAQSENIVMTIKTGELPPVVIQNLTTNAPRYYWRSVVYDQYVSGGWYTTSSAPQPIEAGQPMIAGVLTGHKLLHLHVQMRQPEGRLHWSGMLYNADVPLTVDWRLRPSSNLFADQTDLLQADMFAARTDAAAYRADTFVPIPSIEQLRAVPEEEYPEHIRRHYLALPPSVPLRVRRLAREITAEQQTGYDKAKAIETYLRVNYPYDLEIDAPPQDQDVADYFLFDLQRGYCDYYATAMVVLARANGLPARFVSGYSSGEYDAPNAQYVVREKHAHSWAEVYFPEIGWVEFEPTGNQPEIERLEAIRTPTQENEVNDLTREILFELTSLRVAPILLPLGILLALTLLYFAVIEPLLFLRVAPALAIEVLYKRLYRSGRSLAGERTRAETAHEFSSRLVQRMRQVHEHLQLKGHSHRVQRDVESLTTIYQSTLFSERVPDTGDVRQALRLWSRLRWSLFVERIKHIISTRTKRQDHRLNP